ncbi:MAG: HIT domain-containing protein [Candidatus Accumulibacter sp.]|jgi:diadenosine tetraphosphate (Ap4A) HIT family hydrolase|nr:HIT domain-containing protein [Accumulibacter sp.]
MDDKIQSCFYCEKGKKLDSLMLKIIDLPYSVVYLNRNQQHRGRCIVAYRRHKSEYFQLDAEENAGFFADVSQTAQALYNLFHPGKINYATFGDLVPHVHVHVVPKYEGEVQWGIPFQNEPEKFLSDSEYHGLIRQIKTELLK